VYPSSQIYSSLYFVIELSLCWSCEQWAPSPIDPHRCTRPPSAVAFQAIKMPDRCTAGLIHTREGVRQPRCRPSVRVRHRSAVHAFSGRPEARFRAAITPLSAAVHAGPALPIKDAAMIRQPPRRMPVRFRNLHAGPSVNHLPIASQGAESEMPTKYTSDDFPLIMLHQRGHERYRT
jgi:hypothetical protein